jgi:hypothetical protein
MEKSSPGSLSKKIRAVEKDLTKGLLRWKMKREGMPPAGEETLNASSERIVESAHTLMKKQGEEILKDLKKARQAFMKAYRGED